jgi:hypothetical protein
MDLIVRRAFTCVLAADHPGGEHHTFLVVEHIPQLYERARIWRAALPRQ